MQAAQQSLRVFVSCGGSTVASSIEFDTQSEESMKALRLILAAWDEGEETGVAPEMMAYAALFTALSDLIDIYGEDAVAGLAKGLENRVRMGEFTMVQTRQ
jgi:hypothetical protein